MYDKCCRREVEAREADVDRGVRSAYRSGLTFLRDRPRSLPYQRGLSQRLLEDTVSKTLRLFEERGGYEEGECKGKVRLYLCSVLVSTEVKFVYSV